MSEITPDQMVPIAEAALQLRLNREQLIRRIQGGVISGGKALGYWYVERQALTRALAEQRAPA